MKLFKKLRKGFTLIELVVVIAVVAILSAVSIVSYVAITNKAHNSNDQLYIDQVNTSLTGGEILEKPATMHDALKVAEADGFKVENFKAESKSYEFAYSMKDNRFVIMEDDKVVYPKNLTGVETGVNLWKFASSNTLPEGYSYYLLDSVSGPITAKGGIDVGKNTNITSVEYSHTGDPQNVVIRTNGGKLTINAEKDIVNHYNEVQTLDIEAVDLEHSYHEFGKVGYATIAKGHFVAEAKSEIRALVNEGAKDSVKIDKDNSATIVRAFTTDNSAKLTEHGGNVSLGYLEASGTQTVEQKLEEIKHDAEAEFLAAIMVNGVYYLDIKDAFDRVASNSGDGYVIEGNTTVTLFKDVEDNGIVVYSSSNLIFDFNGHAYYVKGTVGSSKTTTNGFQLLQNANVTFKNGMLTCTETSSAKLLIQNYANLTLDNMILDGTNLKEYKGTLSTNNGNVVIKDTTIIAKENSFAFDVCSFGQYTGANVKVEGNSVINGIIDLGIYTNKDSFAKNVENWCLQLNSGDFSACIIRVTTDFKYGTKATECTEEQKTNFYNNVITKTQKGSNVNIAPPTGYTWVNNPLAKAD